MKINLTVSVSSVPKVNLKKIKKISKNWYRIVIKYDPKWDLPTEVVDIFKHTTGDWAVQYNEGEDLTGIRADTEQVMRPDRFTKLDSAKLYAVDYAEFIANGYEGPRPRPHAPKYD